MPTNFSAKQMSICIAFDRQQLAFGDDCTDSTGTEQTLASCISSCASMIDKYIFQKVYVAQCGNFIILCEINFWEFRGTKTVIETHLDTLNFDF